MCEEWEGRTGEKAIGKGKFNFHSFKTNIVFA